MSNSQVESGEGGGGGGGKSQKDLWQLTKQFEKAFNIGDLKVCKQIIDESEEGERLLNSYYLEGGSILHLAARKGRVSTIRWLLSDEEGGGRSLGFNKVLARTRSGETAFHLAVIAWNLEACKAIVNGCRVENGEREEMINAVTNERKTGLHLAALASIASWLLSDEEGGGRSFGFNNVLARTKDGENALHIAAADYCVQCCNTIINGCREENGERQEMINSVTNTGRTTLYLAARQQRFDNFAAIVNGLRIKKGQPQQAINATTNVGWTVLHRAAHYGRVSVIDWILSEDGGRAGGFNLVSARTGNGKRTALHLAADSTTTTRALLSNCTSEERMNLFLAVDSEHGWTVLHDAVRENRTSVLVELLSYPEHRFIVNRKDNRGMTVLHRAIIRGIDKESRNEPHTSADVRIVRKLLGMIKKSSSSSSSKRRIIRTTAATEWIDPNIGLGF